MDDKLVKFFEVLREYNELTDYENYTIFLIALAEKNLSLEELNTLTPYIKDIINKTVEVREKKSILEKTLTEFKPRYRGLLDEINRILENVVDFKKFLEISRKKIKGEDVQIFKNLDKVDSLRDELRKELEFLHSIKSKKEFEEFIDLIDGEINKIKEAINKIDSFHDIISPNLENIRKAWKLIGYKVYVNGNMVGFVQKPVHSLPELRLYLQIAREKVLSERELQDIYSNLYKKLVISESYDEFKNRLINEIKTLLDGTDTDIYSPSFLRKYFVIRNMQIDDDVKLILSSEIKTVGYLPIEEVVEADSINKVIHLKDEKSIVKLAKVVPALSYEEKRESYVGRQVLLDDEFKYAVFRVAWLPNYGMSAILLRRDDLKNPVPDSDFVKKILMFLETKKESGRNEKSNNSSNREDLHWKLRVLVMRTLRDIKDLTENKALQPKFLFEFILRKRVPILYPELYQTYFSVLPLPYINKKDDTLLTRVPIKPKYLRKVFTEDEVKLLIGEECGEFLGTIVKKNEGVFFVCCSGLSQKIVERVKKEFGVKENLLKLAKGNVKKFIRSLIIAGYISNRDDYNKLMNILNIKEISYEDLIDPMIKDLKLLTQFHFLKNLRIHKE